MDREQAKGRAINISVAAAMAVGLELLLLFSLAYFRDTWGGWYTFTVVLGSVLNAVLLGLEILFYIIRKEVVYKSLLTAYILFVFALAVLLVLLKTGFFEIVRDEEALEQYLSEAGVWMGVLFVVLQFLQVVILPIPSFVTVAAGTALFGPLKCAFYSLAGIVLGSVTAFIIGRYFGSRVVAWLIGKDVLDKWLKKVKGKDKLLLSAMFLLPIFPDDVLCFVAGLSSMSFVFFLVVILISRVLAIFTTCYSVTLIPFNTWWGILTWALLFVAVGILLVILYKKSDAIQEWINKKLHRETRVVKKKQPNEFRVEIVDPDGTIVEKGVEKEPKEEEDKEEKTD